MLIHEQIKGNRYDRSVGTDRLKLVFEHNKLSNFTEVLQQYSTNGILADREGKIYMTSQRVNYINTLLNDPVNKSQYPAIAGPRSFEKTVSLKNSGIIGEDFFPPFPGQ